MKKKTNRENLLEALTPLPLSPSLSRCAVLSLSLLHRAYVLFLTFAEVAKGGWTREVYKVNWWRFFHLARPVGKKTVVFLSSSTLGRKNQPLSLLLPLAPRFPFPSTKNRPSTSRSRSCRRLPSSRSSTPSSASSSRRSSPPVSFFSLSFLFSFLSFSRREPPSLSNHAKNSPPPQT